MEKRGENGKNFYSRERMKVRDKVPQQHSKQLLWQFLFLPFTFSISQCFRKGCNVDNNQVAEGTK